MRSLLRFENPAAIFYNRLTAGRNRMNFIKSSERPFNQNKGFRRLNALQAFVPMSVPDVAEERGVF